MIHSWYYLCTGVTFNMAQTSSTTLFLAGADVISLDSPKVTKSLPTPTLPVIQRVKPPQQSQYRLQIVWRNVIAFFFLHSLAVFGLFRMSPKPATVVYCKYTMYYFEMLIMYFARRIRAKHNAAPWLESPIITGKLEDDTGVN